MNTIENGFSPRQPESLNGFAEDPRALIYLRLLDLDSISLQILKAVGENNGIKSKELEEKVKLSRSPVLNRTKKMSEDDFLSRSIVPGTESHSKPTYSYSLPSNVSLIAINCAIARFSVHEYLGLEGNGRVEAIVSDKHKDSKPSFLAFEVVQELLETAFKKIAELENRLHQVEEVLQQPSTFDREKILNILKANKD